PLTFAGSRVDPELAELVVDEPAEARPARQGDDHTGPQLDRLTLVDPQLAAAAEHDERLLRVQLVLDLLACDTVRLPEADHDRTGPHHAYETARLLVGLPAVADIDVRHDRTSASGHKASLQRSIRVDEREASVPPRRKDTDARRRRDEVDAAAEPAPTLGVTARSPVQELRAEDEPRFAFERYECAVRELVQRGLMRAASFRVQAGRELGGSRRVRGGEKARVAAVRALGPRRVAGGECGRLIEEQEPRVAVRRHRPARAVAATDLQTEGDPPLPLPLPANDTVLVVQAST